MLVGVKMRLGAGVGDEADGGVLPSSIDTTRISVYVF